MFQLLVGGSKRGVGESVSEHFDGSITQENSNKDLGTHHTHILTFPILGRSKSLVWFDTIHMMVTIMPRKSFMEDQFIGQATRNIFDEVEELNIYNNKIRQGSHNKKRINFGG